MSDMPPFGQMNEEDVRAVVIEPLLRNLGYQTGTENDIRRNVPLRYPRRVFGRRKPHKDQELPRGYVDFIVVAKGRVSWVLEAKPPSVEIGEEEIDQAWSYAYHPNVKAAYYVVCNGRMLSVFQTFNTADFPPLLSLNWSQLKSHFHSLWNLLSPEAIARQFHTVHVDPHPPIGPGLGSIARITKGLVTHKENNFGSQDLSSYQWWVEDGDVQRNDDGHLVAFLKTRVHDRRFQDAIEKLGLAQFEMTSQESHLSTDPNRPTHFVYRKWIAFRAGEEVFDLTKNKPVQIPNGIELETEAIARGVLSNRKFSGVFETRFRMPGTPAPFAMLGSFEVSLE